MNPILHYGLLLIIPTTILVHLIYAPYTKVEESFNIQAIHDILTYGVSVDDASAYLQKHYDHFVFPGSVPRTFVGALSVASVSWPFVGWFQEPKDVQVLVRGIVGLGNAFALLAFQNAVSQSFGRVAGYWYIVFQASQFHVMYYASRTLPNMYAFGLCTLALRQLMLSHFGAHKRRAWRVRIALYLLTISGIIFRCEVALLLACQTAWLLFVRRISLRHVIIPAGIAAMTIGLLTTVAVDSFFWQHFPIWPEWVAFRYNTIEGKSSDWGTSPWYFYFANAIPRLMMNPLTLVLCIPVALADRLTRRFSLENLLPLLAFVALYSFLPHKEWRFILYIIPGLTAVASAGAAYISNRRSKHWLYALLFLSLIASTVLSFMASAGLLYISSLNYPGAIAINRLHVIAESERPLIRVHLDNLACQTGVTRFSQKRVPAMADAGWQNQTVWFYDKTEDEALKLTPEFWERFDYVIAQSHDHVLGNWEVLEAVEGYAGIGLSRGQLTRSPLNGTREPQIHSGESDIQSKPPAMLDKLYGIWQQVEHWLTSHVTKGRWPYIMMEPKLYILKKQDV